MLSLSGLTVNTVGLRGAALRAFAATAAGIAATRPAVLPWWAGVALAAAGLALARVSRGWSLYAVLCGAAFVLGAAGRGSAVNPEMFRADSFVGVVVEEPFDEGCRSFVADLVGPGSGRVRVMLRGRMPGLRYGDLVRVRGRIRRFSFPRNPGSPDFSGYYESRGFIGELKAEPRSVAVIGRGRGSVVNRLLVIPLRRHVQRTAERYLPEAEASLFVSLLLGEKSELPSPVRAAFRDSGTMHVLAVSGLHVGILAGLVWLLVSLVQMRGWWRSGLAAAVVVLYVLVTGARAPALRAGVMSFCVLLALPLQRKTAPLSGLGVAGILILLFDPKALLSVGFQLSFAAAWAIIAGSALCEPLIARVRPRFFRNWLARPLAVSVCAFLGTGPLLLAHFHRVQVLSALFSPITVLLVSIAVPLGLLVLILASFWAGAAGVFVPALQAMLSLLLSLTRFFGGQHWAIWEPGAVPVPALAWFYCLLILATNWRSGWARVGLRLGLALGMNALVWAAAFRHPVMRATFLDPGQGDCLVLEDTLGRVAVVDAGVRGQGVLRDYLRYRGIHRIDLAVITHPDNDHYGGLSDLPPGCAVKRLVVSTASGGEPYRRLLDRLGKRGAEVTVAGKGSAVTGFGFGLEFVWPEDAARDVFRRDASLTNLMSLVSILQYAGYRMLLTGDMEETALLGSECLQVDLLKSPHHGSKKGNPQELYERMQPTRVVVMGRYPTPAGLEQRLAGYEDRYVNTRRDGAWQVEFGKAGPVFRYLTSRAGRK